MTTLAKDAPRTYELGDINEFGVIASDIIYEGAAVGENGSGYARPLVAGDPFLGFAERKVDNSSGSAGDKNVRVISKGKIQCSISSLAITDVGKYVYASDDDTFTLTGSGNTRIGRVCRFVSSGVGIVEFDATPKKEYGVVCKSTSGTTAQNVFGSAGAPFPLTITGVMAVAKDTNSGNMVLKSGTNTVASFAKSTTAGVVTGEDGALTDNVVETGGAVTVESDTTNGDGYVMVSFEAN